MNKEGEVQSLDLESENQSKEYPLNKNNTFVQYLRRRFFIWLMNGIAIAYFAWATIYFFQSQNEGENSSVNPNQTFSIEYCKGNCGIQWCDGYGLLLILFVSTYWFLFYYNVLKPCFGRQIYNSTIQPIEKAIKKIFKLKLFVVFSIVILIGGTIFYVYTDANGTLDKLRSMLGIIILFGSGYIFSKDRKSIKWRPVICGISMQFLFALFCIRSEIGRSVFDCVGKKVVTFLNYTNAGSKFVYGSFLITEKAVFAFAVLSVIFFFSFMISILYFYGAMQWFVFKLGWLLQMILGTTVCESINSAANIFLGMSESPLLIRPYIKYLTASELHSIMTSGFATVSGTVLAAYISYGANPSHLIASSVMAAPASLAFSKLFYPETEESKTKTENITMERSTEHSALDAASNGAMTAISLVTGIIANLIAFVSFIAFANGVVSWFGYLIGLDFLSFEWIFSKLFIPLSYILGIPWEECSLVGRVIASKTIINEFVAYERLGVLKEQGLISKRSAAITTFAICGFANPSSLGIMIGNLSSMCPEQRGKIIGASIRALISGAVVCFINASIVGLLLNDEIYNRP